jgi:hypothetical protein
MKTRIWGLALCAALGLAAAANAAAQHVVWQESLNAQLVSSSYPRSLAVDAAGDVYVTGNVPGPGPNCRVVKYSGASGTLLWETKPSAAISDIFGAMCRVALDASGNVFFAAADGSHLQVAKLAGSTGALLWEAETTSAPPLQGAAVVALAVDGNGNPIVAGNQMHDEEDPLRPWVAKFAGGDGSRLWEYVDSSSTTSGATALALDASGNAIVAGFNLDAYGRELFLTIKIAAGDGTATWRKTFDHPAPNATTGQPRERLAANAVAVDAGGNALVTGYVAWNSSTWPSQARDFETIKYAAADGAMLWEATYDGTAHGTDTAVTINVDGSGDALVTGASDGATSGVDVVIVKYSGTSGAQVWAQPATGPGTGADRPTAAFVDASGDLFVTGSTTPASGIGTAVFSIQISGATGGLLWTQSYQSADHQSDSGIAIVRDAAGNAITFANSSANGFIDFKVLKYANGSGTLAWQTAPLASLIPRYTSPDAMVLDNAGNLFVSSYFRGYTSILDDNEDMILARFSAADGAVAWASMFQGPLPDWTYGVVLDGAGHVIIGGMSTGSNDYYDFMTLGYRADNGQLIWQQPVLGSGHDSHPAGIVYDGAGSVYVYGDVSTPTSGDVRTIIKYASANGALLWRTTASTFGTAYSLALDAGNGVFATGMMVTTKYNSANGAVLWEKSVAGGGSWSYVAVDAAGNPVVAGTSNDGSVHGYRVIKYAGSDGSVLWDQLIPRTGMVNAIKLDSHGDVIVVGAAEDQLLPPVNGLPPPGSIVYMGKAMKLSGSDGSLIWERNVSPGTVQYVSGTGLGAVALDAADNVIAAGGSATPAGGPTMKAMAYAASNGRALWQYSYDGATHLGGYANAVVTAPGAVFLAGPVKEPDQDDSSVHLARLGNLPTRAAAGTDLDGNGRSDLVWRNTATGDVYRIGMNGLAIDGQGPIYSEPNLAWRIVSDADFNGDGIEDLLWRNDSTGEVYFMPFGEDGFPASGGHVIYREPNAAWKIVATPDLDGDGKADLLWWNSATGQVFAQLFDGAAITTQGYVYTEPNTAWKIAAAGDFGGIGIASGLVWRNDVTGDVYLMSVALVDGHFTTWGRMIHQEPNLAWKIVGAADLDGDGCGEILWRNDATGQVNAMTILGGQVVASDVIYNEPNLDWKIVAFGDYDGDGRSDIVWRNATDGRVFVMLMRGHAIGASTVVYTEPNPDWRLLGAAEYAH